MFAEFRQLDGPGAPETHIIRKDFATIGRHPSTDITFSAEQELEVSGRHAAVFRLGDQWVLRDLASTNGTWVNGARISGDHTLHPEEVIRFGAKGPRLAFQCREGEPPTVPATQPSSAPAPRIHRPGATTGSPAPIRRRTSAAKILLAAITTIAAMALLGKAGLTYRNHRAEDAERQRLLVETDRALVGLEATSSTVAALRAALDSARDDARRLRAEVAAGGGDRKGLAALSSDVAIRLGRHRAVVRAAELDAAAIGLANADAIALVVSEFPDGRRVAGTGFSVRVRGDTGWIVTVRHLVADSLGRAPVRLGVIFNGSNQNFRAELVARSDSADLALLTVRIRGGMPVVRAVGGRVEPGDPVAILGFPFGLEFPLAGDWRKSGVSVRSFAGSLYGMTRSRLDVNGFGASGSSGSPLFNAAGEVVGVVFGGDPRSAGGIVYAIPTTILEAMLATLFTRG